MAILISPGTDVTVIDQTFYIPALATTVPVIFGVTAAEKTQPDGVSIAAGTYEYNKLRPVTSVAQSLALYGHPKFYRDDLGNMLHGDSRNEYGLAAMNYFLGIGSVAYFIRANVDPDDSREHLAELWTAKMLLAATKARDDVAARIAAINAANGWSVGNPNYVTSMTINDLWPYVTAALTQHVYSAYPFREKDVDPDFVTWSNTDTYAVGDYVYYNGGNWLNGKFYRSLAASNNNHVPTSLGSNWEVVDVSWKNTPVLFTADRPTSPMKVFAGPSGYSGVATDTYIGLQGMLKDIETVSYYTEHVYDDWSSSVASYPVGTIIRDASDSNYYICQIINGTAETGGAQDPSVQHMVSGVPYWKLISGDNKVTPVELYNVMIDAGDDFLYTKEFQTSTLLGVDDAARRPALVTALQSAVLNTRDLYSEGVEYTLILAPGFPELADDLNLLNQNNYSEAVPVTDGPMNMDPDDYVTWANAASASALSLPSGRALPSGFPNRQRGDNCYYYGASVITNTTGDDVVVPNSVIGLRQIAYSDYISYPWFAPAGFPNGQLTGVSRVGYLSGDLGTITKFVDAPLTKGQRDLFAQSNINAIPFLYGSGYVVFSQTNSASVVSEMSSINVDRCVKYIKRGLRKYSRPFLFKPNDQYTRDQFKSFVEAFLGELVTLRALYDFAVLCDSSNNTPDRVARKEMWCEVAIQPVTAIEFIYIPITVQKPN